MSSRAWSGLFLRNAAVVEGVILWFRHQLWLWNWFGATRSCRFRRIAFQPRRIVSRLRFKKATFLLTRRCFIIRSSFYTTCVKHLLHSSDWASLLKPCYRVCFFFFNRFATELLTDFQLSILLCNLRFVRFRRWSGLFGIVMFSV
jgi:hypothetical protein